MAVRFSIGSQSSSPNSEVITASNIKNIKFEIRNNNLDQLQGMSAKMAAIGFEPMPAPTSDVHWNRGRSNQKESNLMEMIKNSKKINQINE